MVTNLENIKKYVTNDNDEASKKDEVCENGEACQNDETCMIEKIENYYTTGTLRYRILGYWDIVILKHWILGY